MAIFRRPLNAADVIEEIQAARGRIDYHEEGHGLAVYKEEDPFICRMEASWARRDNR